MKVYIVVACNEDEHRNVRAFLEEYHAKHFKEMCETHGTYVDPLTTFDDEYHIEVMDVV
jgi:organic radical activating enzyme